MIALNRAVAIGPVRPAAAWPRSTDRRRACAAHLLPAARADFLRRLGRWPEAAAEYRGALELADNGPERAFLAGRLAVCEKESSAR